MKKTSTILLLILFWATSAIAQETFSSTRWRFSMELPQYWTSMNKETHDAIADNFEFSEEALKKILDGDKGTTFIAAYYYQKPGQGMSVHPQVQVQARRKGPVNFAQFRTSIVNSIASFKTIFPDIVFSDAKEVEVSGIRSVLMTGVFSIKGPDNRILRARSRIYAVPLVNYFFQITLNDGQDPDADFGKEFDGIVKTIRVGR
jgi:hypothetical protein